MSERLTRRELLGGTAAGAAAAGLCLSPMVRQLLAEEPKPPMKIGACDWSLGCRQNPKVFELAKAIGLHGVEVSFDGGEKFNLRDAEVRKRYRELSEASGVEISSLAMGVLNGVPYSTSPEAERWVRESVDVLAKMDVKIVLMAFFGRGNIKGKRDLQDAVIGRLKKVAPKAEEAGVVLGIESMLDADDHLRILEGVDSPAVKVYYDVANMTYAGYDVPKEIRRLGRERICQIHMKENGHLLGRGKVDFSAIKEAINDIGYDGWLIIESATEKGRGIEACYVENRKFLERLFAADDS